MPDPSTAGRRRAAGCRSRDGSRSYPPYMSVSSSPIDAIRSVTACPPELVEPPSHTSSSFAASLSETTSIRRSTPSSTSPAQGRRSARSSAATAIAELQRRRGGKLRPRVPGCAGTARQTRDVDARGARKPAATARICGLQPPVVVRRAQRRAAPPAGGRGRGRPSRWHAARARRRPSPRHVVSRSGQVDANGEVPSAQRRSASDAASGPDDDAPRARRRPSR